MVSPFTKAKRDGKKTINTENGKKSFKIEIRKTKIQGTKPLRDRKTGGSDGIPAVCSACEGLGELNCCDKCGNMFHLSCVGVKEASQINPWLCIDCLKNQVAGLKNNLKNIFVQLRVPETPVDFQIPDSLKKWKPHPYTYIKRNAYLTKRKLSEDDGMQCSCRPSSSGLAKVCDKDCLCAMLNFSCSSSCGCGELCVNKSFQQRPIKKLKLSKTEKCGWGVKAGEDINEGDFLIEYVGEVIDDKTCEERLWKMKERGETNFYLLEINREMVIDATYKANKSRFINHSCRPNTELQKWQNDGETRIGVFAKTNIKKGEFVTYDYQFIQFGTDQQCYCGAPDCRRFLGAKASRQKLSSDAAMRIVAQEIIHPRLLKNSHKETLHGAPRTDPDCIGQHVRVLWPLDHRFYSGKIVSYDASTDQHTINYDDGDTETLVMSKETWEFDLSITPPQGMKLATNGFVDPLTDNTRSATIKQK